jgi:hypothetical protein
MLSHTPPGFHRATAGEWGKNATRGVVPVTAEASKNAGALLECCCGRATSLACSRDAAAGSAYPPRWGGKVSKHRAAPQMNASEDLAHLPLPIVAALAR